MDLHNNSEGIYFQTLVSGSDDDKKMDKVSRRCLNAARNRVLWMMKPVWNFRDDS